MQHYALLGDPVSHSLSPMIYNALFRRFGIEAEFHVLKTTASNIKASISSGLSGFACTMPLKREIIPYLSSLSPEAESMGSVNIVTVNGGRLKGYSTDAEGVSGALLEAGFVFDDRVALVIGSGGASRAASFAAIRGGARLRLAARNAQTRGELCAHFNAVPYSLDELESAADGCDILINASPLGMSSHEPFAELGFLDRLSPAAAVCDMVYEPRSTQLLEASRARGLCGVDGISVLLNQAYPAFALWTGITPDEEARQYVRELLRGLA